MSFSHAYQTCVRAIDLVPASDQTKAEATVGLYDVICKLQRLSDFRIIRT